MALSGTKTFELDISEYIEEAFERCGLEVRTGYDLRTARRSLNLLLAEWANRGLNRWTVQTVTAPTVASTGDYALGAETIDVLDVVIRQDGKDRKLTRISREDYTGLGDKSQSGPPSMFYVDRTISPTLKLWPLPEDDSYTIVYDRMARMDDGTFSDQTVQVPFRFYPALAAGLAFYLAMKRAPERVMLLKQAYEEEFKRAIDEDRDRASFFVLPAKGYRRI
jgi:hypothetical protein